MSSFDDLEERVSAIEKQVVAAGISLQETAKRITSGVAVAAAGVIAGTSLSSLGELGVGWRLFGALSAGVVAIGGLGYLFASALKVIVPPSLTLQDFADGREISADWKEKIELRTKPLLKPFSVNTLKDFCDYLRAPTNHDGSALSPNETRSLNVSRRLIGSTANSELRRLLFSGLTLKTFVITPIIALAIFVFAWAATPAKEEVVPTLEKLVVVNQDDIALLGKALGGSGMCRRKVGRCDWGMAVGRPGRGDSAAATIVSSSTSSVGSWAVLTSAMRVGHERVVTAGVDAKPPRAANWTATRLRPIY
jgi:MFS family permease